MQTKEVAAFVRIALKMPHTNLPVTHRDYGQRQRQLCQIQRGLLRQHRNQLHEADQPPEPGDQGEGELLTHVDRNLHWLGVTADHGTTIMKVVLCKRNRLQLLYPMKNISSVTFSITLSN